MCALEIKPVALSKIWLVFVVTHYLISTHLPRTTRKRELKTRELTTRELTTKKPGVMQTKGVRARRQMS